MPKAAYKPYRLHFRNPVLTSRGAMRIKQGYYLSIGDGEKTGIGECSFIEGLSIDDLDNYEKALRNLCRFIEAEGNEAKPDLSLFPSICFGLECALLDLENGGRKILFESQFTKGEKQIPINGLVWMGEKNFMLSQIEQKLNDGFRCIKIKVGAVAFDEELMLLNFIRQKYPADKIEIRLDANGAFTKMDVFKKLDVLSKFSIHSIEQPVRAGQWELMKEVCSSSPIPVALDEELIGIPFLRRAEMLAEINPAFIILKPSLLGGIESCNNWIELAQINGTGWWATSALESNIGLSAIAQWVFMKNNNLVQGLGTGGLFTDNISSPLFISKGLLGYDARLKWGSLEIA